MQNYYVFMARTFGLLRDIEVGVPETWNDKIFLTLDVDWAADEVIRDSLEILSEYGVPATWFFTHDSPFIQLLQESGHEVGIHPNFNQLLVGDSQRTYAEILDEALAWCAEARSSRSHSLVYGSQISAGLYERSILYSSNFSIPVSAGISLSPWRSTSGIVEVPYSWADEFAWHPVEQPDIVEWTTLPGLLVADFHPIHVFLNSESSARYNQTRVLHGKPEELLGYRYEGSGTRSQLLRLCKEL